MNIEKIARRADEVYKLLLLQIRGFPLSFATEKMATNNDMQVSSAEIKDGFVRFASSAFRTSKTAFNRARQVLYFLKMDMPYIGIVMKQCYLRAWA